MGLKLADEISHFRRVFGISPALPVFQLLFEAFADEPEDLPDFFFGRFPVVDNPGIPFAPAGIIDEMPGGFFFEANGVSFVVEGVEQIVGKGELFAGHGLSLPGRAGCRVEEPEKILFFGSFGFVVDDVFFDGPKNIFTGIAGGEDVFELAVFVEVDSVGPDVETDSGVVWRKRFCDRFKVFYGVTVRQGGLKFVQGHFRPPLFFIIVLYLMNY